MYGIKVIAELERLQSFFDIDVFCFTINNFILEDSGSC